MCVGLIEINERDEGTENRNNSNYLYVEDNEDRPISRDPRSSRLFIVD